jgi:predicted O-methyltransferase YrrM
MTGPILNPKIEEYLDDLLPKRDPLLNEMEKLARRRDIAIIGPACGRLLYLLAKLTGAKRVFEMGSAIGYSTIWWARAVGPQGKVFYTDGDASNARRAREYFERAGLERRITVLVGDAMKSLEKTSGKFDIIFIDVDKPQYLHALNVALPKLRRGGLLVTDNTLWYGRVVSRAADESTRTIREFNRRTYAKPTLYPVIVPLRDGVTVAQKL